MTEPVADDSMGPRCWTYWVAYRHRDGLGAVAVSLALPLRAACQLLMLARRIEREESVRDVVVLSWALLLASGGIDALTADLGPASAHGSVPELALRALIAAGERVGNPVANVAMELHGTGLAVSVHLQSMTSASQAGALLAELGYGGEPREREYRTDKPFVVRSGLVEIGGAPVVVKVFCEASP